MAEQNFGGSSVHNERGELLTCAVAETCSPGVLSDWFSIVLVTSDKEVAFCPRHALAAEALSSIGLPCDHVVARLKTLALQHARKG